MVELEPQCGPDYEDTFNGGCNTVPYEFKDLDPGQYITLCGETGVYTYYGSCWRDTDWYELVLDEPREIDFCIMAGFDYQLLIIDEVDGCNEFYITRFVDRPTVRRVLRNLCARPRHLLVVGRLVELGAR